MFNFFIKSIILIFIINGCSSLINNTNGEKKEYTQKEYEIIKQRKEFIKKSNAFLIHKMSKDVISNYINLPTLSKNMIFVISSNDLDMVHYIKNSENDKINIDTYLIDGLEYFYDKVNKEILVIYNLPFSYFLQNNIKFNLKIIGSLDGKLIEKNIIFDFTYHFMKKPTYFNKDTHNPSFAFVDFDDKDISENIKKILKSESKQINTKRLSKNYAKLYNQMFIKVIK